MKAGWIAPDWPAPVAAAVTTRELKGASLAPFDSFNLGGHCGDEATHVAVNRVQLIRDLDLPQPPRWLRQVHGNKVMRFARRSPYLDHAADAAVTSDVGVVLAILTADCLPVLFASTDGSEVAAAHAGWRGLAGGVLEATLRAMTTSVDRVHAWLGPAIGAASYEVGTEVHGSFVARDSRAAAAFRPSRDGHWWCDLYLLASLRLRDCGIAQIHGGGFDTLAEPRFYSYRRDARTGRMASLIWRQTPR